MEQKDQTRSLHFQFQSPEGRETPLAVSSSTSELCRSQIAASSNTHFSTFHGWNETFGLEGSTSHLGYHLRLLDSKLGLLSPRIPKSRQRYRRRCRRSLRLVGCQLPPRFYGPPGRTPARQGSHNLWSFGHGGSIDPGCFPAKFNRNWRTRVADKNGQFVPKTRAFRIQCILGFLSWFWNVSGSYQIPQEAHWGICQRT